MTPADQARDSALHCEAKKHAYRQTQDGVVVSFVLHPDEVPGSLATAPLGARYVLALVQIGDDELPVPAKENGTKPRQVKPRPDGASREKMDWRDMPVAQRAGILINDAVFAAYLREHHPDEWHETGDADACLKFICKIESKRDLAVNARAEQMFDHLTADYRAWQAAERVGA